MRTIFEEALVLRHDRQQTVVVELRLVDFADALVAHVVAEHVHVLLQVVLPPVRRLAGLIAALLAVEHFQDGARHLCGAGDSQPEPGARLSEPGGAGPVGSVTFRRESVCVASAETVGLTFLPET